MTATARKEKSDSQKGNSQVALIAGGAGFIGSHLCEALLNQSWKVVCVDNLSTGSKENIKGLLVNPNFHFIEADITAQPDFLEGLEELTAIFHLASLETQVKKQKFSLETLLVNSSGTKNLLEAAKKYQAKFILVSSADIYQGRYSSTSLKAYFGDGKREAVMSQHEAKRFAEALTVEFFKNYGLEAVIARVSDVYGPRMSLEAEGALPALISSAKNGENLVIAGDGLTTLNPTFVSDVVFGLIKIASGDFKGEIFNLIDPEKTTLLGLAETIRLVAGDLEIVHEKTSSNVDFPPPNLDLEDTKEKLKWHPRVSLAEGLSSTFQFLRASPAKLLDLGGEAPVLAERVVKRGEGSKRSHLRLLIFSASLALVILTTLVPLGSFIWNTQEATKALFSANDFLEEDKTDSATSFIKTLQKKTASADQSLSNIRWIFQLSGQASTYRTNEQYLLALESSAVSLELTAKAVENIIEIDQLTKDGEIIAAREKLNETNQFLIDVQQSLNLSKTNLEQIKPSKLVPGLSGQVNKVKALNEKLATLTISIAEELKASLEVIGEAGSTVP